MTLLVAYFAVALGFSFLCSILEAVLLSVSPGFVGQMQEEKPKLGSRLRALQDDVDRPLAAILSLNTMANTVGAAGVGAQAQETFGSNALAIASAILTVLILVFAEIIPKTVGAVYWRRLTPFMVRALPVLMFVMTPFVWLAQFITRVIKRDAEVITVSREEIAALARIGAEQGVFQASESRILTNLLRLKPLRARDIMTPRTVLFSLSADTKITELVPVGSEQLNSADRASTTVFSRIPIYGTSPDDVLGYVLKDELYLAAAKGELDRPLSAYVRPLTVVPEGLPVIALFEKLLKEREHLALVVDEYGGVDGVVTMEDVLETLLGLEIVDEVDTTEDLREMARRQWCERREALGTVPPPPMIDHAEASEIQAEVEPKGDVVVGTSSPDRQPKVSSTVFEGENV